MEVGQRPPLQFSNNNERKLPFHSEQVNEIEAAFSPRLNDKSLARAFKEHLCRTGRF
jgi:hypothetical protein